MFIYTEFNVFFNSLISQKLAKAKILYLRSSIIPPNVTRSVSGLGPFELPN